ncbi:MAG: hypothetical protein NC389_09830 [Acetatifactor muris]|nr:hypothetical protein [Acetatifactor muris]
MTLLDIRNGLIKILRENTEIEDITGEDITQSGSGSFLHIQLVPLSSRTMAAGHWIRKEILVDIAYMEKLVTSNEKIYAVLDKLDGIFKPFFHICGRAFSPPAQMDITDDIGHYKMTLEFNDAVPFADEEPLAENLRIEWRKKDGIT